MIQQLQNLSVCMCLGLLICMPQFVSAQTSRPTLVHVKRLVLKNKFENKDEQQAEKAKNMDKERQIGLGTTVVAKVNGLDELYSKEQYKGRQLSLSLNGWKIFSTKLQNVAHQGDYFYFYLKRETGNQEAWNSLFFQAYSGLWYSKIQVIARLHVEGVGELPVKPRNSDDLTLQLRVYSKFWFWIFLVAFAFVVGLFFWLASVSNLLREAGPSPGGGKRKPFSLGLTQMAWWFFIISTSFVAIWFITDSFSSLTTSILGLMGIGSGTALGSYMLQPKSSDETPRETRGFFTDLVSDENGVSFHRFQMVAWTVYLGVIFLMNVYTSLTMPNFDTTLLALMGISSGTYLGFKIPQKQKQ